jgi:hypothetical protein
MGVAGASLGTWSRARVAGEITWFADGAGIIELGCDISRDVLCCVVGGCTATYHDS